MDKDLSSYYDPADPGSYGGVERLYRSLKEKGEKVKYADVKDFLKQQNTYTLHKDKRNNFKRNRIIALTKDYQWAADLADLSTYARDNKGVKYLLTVIDVFTKFLWLKPLKDKKPDGVQKAFAEIFAQGRKPERLRTDQGKEFVNRKMADFLKEEGVAHLLTTNKTYKAATVERVQRTMKGRMYRYFTRTGKHEYIDKLQDFVDSYNNSYHRSVKMTPNQACVADRDTVFRNLYGDGDVFKEGKKKPKLKTGDTVRIAYDRGVFDKGFWRTHSDNTAVVEKVIDRVRPMYVLKDHAGSKKRRYYDNEVQGIPEPSYRVEKVLKTRTKDGRRQFFVKFIGYPSSENAWVDNLEQV